MKIKKLVLTIYLKQKIIHVHVFKVPFCPYLQKKAHLRPINWIGSHEDNLSLFSLSNRTFKKILGYSSHLSLIQLFLLRVQ